MSLSLVLTLVNLRHSKSLLKSLSTHVQEHYSNASYGIYPIEGDSKLAIIVVANKYSPNNFWYGAIFQAALALD